MTDTTRKPSRYKKRHLLAVGSVAALFGLSLLLPSAEVEARKNAQSTSYEVSLQDALDQEDDKLLSLVTQDVQESTQTTLKLPTDQFRPAVTTASDTQNSPEPQPETASRDADSAEPAAATPPAAQPEVAAGPNLQHLTVENGDTLATLFERASLSATTLHRILDSHPDARRLSGLRPGQIVELELDPKGELQRLSTSVSALETLSVARKDNGYQFNRELITPEIREARASGVITSSLFSATRDAGLPYGMTLDLANIFDYDVDFAQDLREGDRFEVIYEEKLVDGKRVGTGNILAARFVNNGKTLTAVRYTGKNGNSSYYTAEGNSMRKAFIRTPVDIARISSGFSRGRLHPILNKIRAHKGVDYSAPIGTAIKATGDGKVFLAGRQGGYGNVVIIQHGNSYRTLYGHMNGFAPGVRTGSPVRQGQIIGYVGTTGLSSGPHLHYEFQVNGQHVDPLSQKLPMAEPIARTELAQFQTLSRELMARLDQPAGTTRLASSGN